MIKAKGEGDGKIVLILGLSSGNIEKLIAGQPIQIKGEDLGLSKPVDITIFYGETEQEMEVTLRKAGLITDQTKTYIDPKLR